MGDLKCYGEHNVYVAEVVYDGHKLIVITVCKLCNSVTFHEKILEGAPATVTFLKNKVKEE